MKRRFKNFNEGELQLMLTALEDQELVLLDGTEEEYASAEAARDELKSELEYELELTEYV